MAEFYIPLIGELVGSSTEIIPLGLTGKNVIDNTVYNYAIEITFTTSTPTSLVFIHEMVFLY